MIPTARIYLIIHDVGPRGGEVAVNLAADGDDITRSFTAKSLDDAADRLKPILRRLMYGADQPDPEPAPVAYRDAAGSMSVEGVPMVTSFDSDEKPPG